MKALIGSILLATFGSGVSAPATETKPAAPAPAKQAEEKTAQIIRITADDSLSLNSVKVTEQQLVEKLRAAAAKDRDLKVIIRGDKAVKYQSIANIIDLCQKAGLWDLSFLTKEA